MNPFPDDRISSPAQPPEPDAASVAGRECGGRDSPKVPEASPTGITESIDAGGPAAASALPVIEQPVTEQPRRDPAWSGLDVLRLTFLALVALFIGGSAVLAVAHFWIYPHSSVPGLTRIPLVAVVGQALGYVLVLAYMYVLVTRQCGRPDFRVAMHWNWPQNIAPYVTAGVGLSLALQLLAHLLPMPRNLPIDTFFQTPAEAWALTVFSVTLAPLMEELFFRGFLYPVLRRSIGNVCRAILQRIGEHLSLDLASWDFRVFSLTAAIFITAFAFALLHGAQLQFSWGPVLVIFLVGVVVTMVRAYKDSVAAGLLIHVAYNGTISALIFVGTDGFRHLEKLNQ